MKTFRITSKSQMAHVASLIQLIILSYLLGKAFMYVMQTDDWTVPFYVISAWILIFNFIPQLILHIRYYHLNKNDVLTFNPEKLELTMEGKEMKSTFLVDEIKLMKQYKSPPLADKRMKWATFDCYNYNIIYLKDGRRFVITSLMVAELILPLDAVKIELKKSGFAYPRKGHVWTVPGNKSYIRIF